MLVFKQWILWKALQILQLINKCVWYNLLYLLMRFCNYKFYCLREICHNPGSKLKLNRRDGAVVIKQCFQRCYVLRSPKQTKRERSCNRQKMIVYPRMATTCVFLEELVCGAALWTELILLLSQSIMMRLSIWTFFRKLLRSQKPTLASYVPSLGCRYTAVNTVSFSKIKQTSLSKWTCCQNENKSI